MSGVRVKKRSPLEQAIAEKMDRRARFDAKQRQAGLKRTTVWVREDALPAMLLLVKAINANSPEQVEQSVELLRATMQRDRAA